MKYLKLWEDFDFAKWNRLRELGLGADEIYTVRTESPHYALGLSDREWVLFRRWAKEEKGVVFASQARGGFANFHVCSWDGPKAGLLDLLEYMKDLDPDLRSWGLTPLNSETVWSSQFKERLGESEEWKSFLRLKELGLSDTEFGYVIITTHEKSLEESLGPEGWAELLEEAEYHGAVRNSHKKGQFVSKLGVKSIEFWESWIGPYKGIERLKNTIDILFSGRNPNTPITLEVNPVLSGLEDFVRRWEWAIQNDVVLLDDYVVK